MTPTKLRSTTFAADNAVTIRDRDTMEQVRVPIAELNAWLADKCRF